MSIRNTILNPKRHRAARNARRSYCATAERELQAARDLEGPEGRAPLGRARLIGQLAAYESEMATLVQACRWNTAEDAEMAAEHHTSATLLALIASTEFATSIYNRDRGPAQWEQAFGTILDDLTNQTDLSRRAELLTRLHIAAHPVVGGPVAENITALHTAYTRLALTTPTPQEQEADQ